MWNPPPLDSAATVVPWQEGCDAYATVSATTDNRRSGGTIALARLEAAWADTGADVTDYLHTRFRLKSGRRDRQSVHIGCVWRYDAPSSAGGALWHRHCDPRPPPACWPRTESLIPSRTRCSSSPSSSACCPSSPP